MQGVEREEGGSVALVAVHAACIPVCVHACIPVCIPVRTLAHCVQDAVTALLVPGRQRLIDYLGNSSGAAAGAGFDGYASARTAGFDGYASARSTGGAAAGGTGSPGGAEWGGEGQEDSRLGRPGSPARQLSRLQRREGRYVRRVLISPLRNTV